MFNSITAAIDLAEYVHGNQVDKAGNPYIGHLLRVAGAVSHLGTKAMILGILHDVLEDSKGNLVVEEMLHTNFDQEIVRGVRALTKLKWMSYIDYLTYVKSVGGDVLAVKIADNRDNNNPDRLALLDKPLAERLKKKYDDAFLFLTMNI